MQWYCIFFDAEGDNDLVETCEQEPSRQELEEMSQACGYWFAGCYQAHDGNEAIAMAERDFEPGGCLA